MMLAVGGQDLIENERQHASGLANVSESSYAAFVQLAQLLAERPLQRPPRPRLTALREKCVGVIQLLLKARIGPALGEVEIAEERLQRRRCFQILGWLVHRGRPSLPNTSFGIFPWLSIPSIFLFRQQRPA